MVRSLKSALSFMSPASTKSVSPLNLLNPAVKAANDLFSAAALRSGAFESFLGSLPSIGQGHVKSKQKARPVGDADELKIESKRKKRLKEYDRMLKGFRYSAALDSVLRKQVPPSTTFSLIQELIHRDGLRTALAGRDDVLLEPVLRLLLKHVADPRFGQMACDVAALVIGTSRETRSLFAMKLNSLFRDVHASTGPVSAHRYPLPPITKESHRGAEVSAGTDQSTGRARHVLCYLRAHVCLLATLRVRSIIHATAKVKYRRAG